MSKQPPPASTASAGGPCSTITQIVGRPGTGSLPRAIAPPDHPLSRDKLQNREQQTLRKSICSYRSKYMSGNNLPRISLIRGKLFPDWARLFKLTTLLVNVSLKFQTSKTEICQYVLLKKCEKLLQYISFSLFCNNKYQCIWL